MFWTTSIIFVLGITATAMSEAPGTHASRRKYSEEDLYLKPPESKSPFLPLPRSPLMGSRYPSRRFNVRTTTLRVKPQVNTVPMISPFGTRTMNAARVRPYGPHGNTKMKIPPIVQPARHRPAPSVRQKPTVPNSSLPSELRPNEKVDMVKMKPVHEEVTLPKMPVYINAFPEMEQTKDVTRNMHYEPLGNYAKF